MLRNFGSRTTDAGEHATRNAKQKPDVWSRGKYPIDKTQTKPLTSWWVTAAQPTDRESFIAAARRRAEEREHASNVILAKQTARFATFKNPIPLTERQQREKRQP